MNLKINSSILIIIISTVLILWSIKYLVLDIFAAIVIAVSICKVTDKIQRKLNVSRLFSLIICLLILLSVFVIGGIIIIPPFLEEFQLLIMQLPNAARTLLEISQSAINTIYQNLYGNERELIINKTFLQENLFVMNDGSLLAKGVTDGFKNLLGIAGDISSLLIQVIFIIFISLMIVAQPNKYKTLIIKLTPSFYRKKASLILDKCAESLGDWMIGMLISSACVASLAGLGLSLLGIKLVIANAILAGILNIIPNIGPVISTIFPISVALIDEPWKAIAVFILYVIIQNLESYVITPSIMQHKINILPALTLSAQLLFTIIFGPLGLILSIPLAVVSRIIVKEVIINDILDTWKYNKLSR
tara:strand:+ start:2244 stop:3326 length:1083 start_codon:yes stop_codon:yes gene_type:complete